MVFLLYPFFWNATIAATNYSFLLFYFIFVFFISLFHFYFYFTVADKNFKIYLSLHCKYYKIM